MNDRPTATELLAAARSFLEAELIPALTDPRLKFQTLVAANVLGIVEREIGTESIHLRAEAAELSEWLGEDVPVPLDDSSLRRSVYDANVRLCDRIRHGDMDERNRFMPLLRLLRRQVTHKLEVANPRYLEGTNRA